MKSGLSLEVLSTTNKETIMTKLPPEGLARVRRVFNTSEGSGLFEIIICAEHEKKAHQCIDIARLIDTYARFQCSNVVALVIYLSEEAPHLLELGSQKIDLSPLFDGVPPTELGLCIGNKDKDIRPLDWLTYLADYLEYLPYEQVWIFEFICGQFLTLLQQQEN